MQIIFSVGSLIHRRLQQFRQFAANSPHIAQRLQPAQFGLPLAFRPQRHHRQRFVLVHFGKRIFQQRAGITDAVAAGPLRPVQVTQRHIVEAVKQRGVDKFHAAERFAIGQRFFRLAQFWLFDPADKAVRNQHVALSRIPGRLNLAKNRLHRRVLVANLRLPHYIAHLGRVSERRQVKVHRAVPVMQRHPPRLRPQPPFDMQPLRFQYAAAKAQPVRAVMVACHHQHRRLKLQHNPAERPVQQFNRLDRRNRPVVHVAGDNQHIRLFRRDQFHQPVQDVGLVLGHVHLIYEFADMPVAGMKNLHESSTPSFIPLSFSRCAGMIPVDNKKEPLAPRGSKAPPAKNRLHTTEVATRVLSCQ